VLHRQVTRIFMFGSKEERGEILIANVFGSRGEGR
jgi:hypothetical protein